MCLPSRAVIIIWSYACQNTVAYRSTWRMAQLWHWFLLFSVTSVMVTVSWEWNGFPPSHSTHTHEQVLVGQSTVIPSVPFISIHCKLTHVPYSLSKIPNLSKSFFQTNLKLIYFNKDIVETHPGLEFLRDAPDFHSRYIHTVSSNL